MADVYSMFQTAAKENPDKVAVVHDELALTYGQISEMIDHFAGYLSSKEISRGQRVAIYIPQGADFLIAALSLAKCGAIIIPVNTHIVSEDVESTVRYINVSHIVVNNATESKIRSLQVSSLLNILNVNCTGKPSAASPACGSSPFVYITTSGSTGKPKVVEVSAEAFPKRIAAERMLFNLSSSDVILVSMPMYHACGFRMSLTALTTGMTLVILSGFTPSRWYHAVTENKATYTIAVPTQLTKIVSWCKEHNLQHSFDSLTHLSSASAFLSEELRNEVLAIYSGNFYNMYASSETDFIALTLCNSTDDINTLGFITKNEQVVIDRINDSDPVGEICCSSAWLFTRYVNDDEMTKNTRRGEFFLTGDLGRFHGDILYYAGRKKNIIISGGINIIPDDIESKLMEMPGIEDCIAYGVEDPILGEAVHVAVKLNPNANIDVKTIRKHCLKRLADFQQPRKIVFVDHVKRNSMGKIVRESVK